MQDTNVQPSDQLRQRMNPKLIVGGIVVVCALAYLVFTAVQGSAAYYLTVAELDERGPGPRMVRVSGLVVDDSIIWRERELRLEFVIADGSGSLPVIYHGPRPDMLLDGAEVVVEGAYEAEGVFDAKALMLKCPSKYQEATPNG